MNAENTVATSRYTSSFSSRNSLKNSSKNAPGSGAESGIIRVHKPARYAVIGNELLRDKRLSFAARGVLTYLLSHAHSWRMQVADLVKQSPAGRDAVYTIIRELKRFGYVRQERTRNSDGTFSWVTTVYEAPQNSPETPAVTTPKSRAKRAPKPSPKSPVLPTDFPEMVAPKAVETHDNKHLSEAVLIEESLTKTHSQSRTKQAAEPKTKTVERESDERKSTSDLQPEQAPELVANTTPTSTKIEGISRFTMEEIVEYVEHLKARGESVKSVLALAGHLRKTIANDRLIASYFDGKKCDQIGTKNLPTNFDPRACPDCCGTGFFYPHGMTKGVARCGHSKLKSSPVDESRPRAASQIRV